METLVDVFELICDRPPDREVVRDRNDSGGYSSMDVQAFRMGVLRRARALATLGVEAESQIALISENRPEWHMYDFALLGLGASTVPIHANMSPEQTAFILEDSESTHLIVSNPEHLSKVLTGLNGVGHLRNIVVMDPPDTIPNRQVLGGPELLKKAERFSERELVDFWEKRTEPVTPDTLATLIYTSGTTGVPKGVMLTHRNIVSNIRSCYEVLAFQEDDVGLSFLPLSHAFERLLDYAYFYCGATIAYSSPDTVVDDMGQVRPTVMASVPRLYEKLKLNVQKSIRNANFIKKTLFHWALRTGRACIEREHVEGGSKTAWMKVKQWVANHLILRPVHNVMGGNLRLVISGGAALDEEVCRFLFGLSIPVIEGYGMTEMSPVVAMNRPGEIRPGTVGKPVPEVEVKIAEDGEVLTRGPNMMKGYYRRYEASARALEGNWFHTGDLGELDEEGNLTIKGRTKYTIVTSWGENVVPQPLERELRSSPYIEQAIIIGDDRKFISALIQPEFEELQDWADEQGMSYDGRSDLVTKDEVHAFIRKEIEQIHSDWADFEQVKEFRLLPEKLTVKKGYLTPTMKVRRHTVKEEYGDLIDEMYREDEEDE